MKNYYVKITVQDPFPKHFDEIGKANTPEVAIKRALKTFKVKHWKGRPLKEVTIYAKLIGSNL